MFEYAREVFTKAISENDQELQLLIKEKKEKETKFEIVDEIRYRRKLLKPLSLTVLFMIIFAGICVGSIGFVGVSMGSILAIVGAGLPLIKSAKDMPGVIKLSNEELEKLINDLDLEIKSLNCSIDNVSNKLDEYMKAIKFFDISDRVFDSLKNLDYAYKYAKDEEEYNDLCEKQIVCKQEWDKFINEPIDYRNLETVKVKKIGAR